MDHTGRIAAPIDPRARRIVFEDAAPDAVTGELRLIAEVDRAHVAMLVQTGAISRPPGARLLRAIERLIQADFGPVRDRPRPRGTYLLYEDYLIATEGAAVGGLLQTARSRNDLNATVMKLALRRPYARAVLATLRLQRDLIAQAGRFAGYLMPTYTHGQPATPGSFGHFLAGGARALGRDILGLLDAARDLDHSPLGAGAAGGAVIPIDAERTAAWLGFLAGPLHAIDAVASRDVVARLLAACVLAGVTASRLAADLWQWLRADCALLTLPDSLVGSSSAMPQKRNPFLLEHVLGRVTTVLGAFTSAVTAMHGAPFSNAIAVGTEAPRPMWRAIDDYIDSVTLLRLVVLGVQPCRPVMRRWTERGFTVAQALAHDLSARNDLDFRTAHRVVGECIASVVSLRRRPTLRDLQKALAGRGLTYSRWATQPYEVMRASRWGGGPAPGALAACLAVTHAESIGLRGRLREQRRRWKDAARTLTRIVGDISAEAPESGGAARSDGVLAR